MPRYEITVQETWAYRRVYVVDAPDEQSAKDMLDEDYYGDISPESSECIDEIFREYEGVQVIGESEDDDGL